MTFDELLDQVCDLLKRQEHVSYLALKIRFQLDDDYLGASRTNSSMPKSWPLTKTGKC
jgi:hypothetical protein